MRYGYIAILASMLLVWGCSENESQRPDGTEQEEAVNSITVMREPFTRATDDVDDCDDDTDDGIHCKNNWRYNTPDNLLPGGDEDVFPEGSRLFIAQITPTRTPNFPTNWKEGNKYDNLWVYKIEKNADADGSSWNSGYNFVPNYSDHSKLDWKTVKSQGSLGNAFSFYAMYYPGGIPKTQLWQQESTWPIDTIKNLDIMGAYHSTPSLYSRMRFRLYHLMVYIRVTVYVPVVKLRYKDGETNKIPENAIGYDGFGPKAFFPNVEQGVTNSRPLVYITSANATPTANNKSIYYGFTVDWRANRSSDTEAPLVNADKSGPIGHIAMHFHRDFSYMDKEGFRVGNVDAEWGAYRPDANNPDSEIFKIDRSVFMDVPDGEDPIEEVRRYEFSAIIPPQSISNTTSLLWLILATPGVDELPDGDSYKGGSTQGTYKQFSFSAQDSKLPVNNGQITLTQGTLQHFYLYVPRTDNKTIVMKANVVPWKYTQTDMIVTEEETTGN